MLAEVLLLEVSHPVLLDPALQHELADVVITLTSDDLTCASLEGLPGHAMLLTVLLVVTFPD